MNRVALLLVFLLIISGINAQRETYPPGWITIDFNSFMCNKTTEDDPLNFDGFGDEVYFVLFYSVANRFGVTKYTNKLISKVYGDTYRFPDRILAGEANPNNKGGMLSGSQFFPGAEFPNIKRIRMEAGDFITVIPTIWEWDNSSNSQIQSSFESRMINSFNTVNLKMVDLIRECFGYYNCYRISNTGLLGIPSFTDILRPLSGAVGSRPIGMNTASEFFPIVFALNSQMIKSQYGKNPVDGKTYAMSYNDFQINEESLGNTRDHGIYNLRFHFTFEQDLSDPPPPPPPPANQSPVLIKNTIKPIKQTISNSNNIGNTLLFPGTWSGTQTSAEGLYPQAIAFQLTANNEYIITDNNGIVAARGTYTVSGNSISGSYKLFSSSETFSFNGTYDNNTQKITGTLGNGNATTGQGKWQVTKK